MLDFGAVEAPGSAADQQTGETDPDVVRYMRWREKRRPRPTYSYRRGGDQPREEDDIPA